MVVVAETLSGQGRTPRERMLRTNGDDITLPVKQSRRQIRHRKLRDGDRQIDLSTSQGVAEALDDRRRNGQSDVARFAPQYLYERHEKSVLYVVVARNPKRSLSAGWIEYAACDETLAVGEQLLQRSGQRLCPRCRQHAALSAYEQRVAQEVA